jgi:uncharacterized protein (DUF2164 family)
MLTRFTVLKNAKKCSCGGTPVLEWNPLLGNRSESRVFCQVCENSTSWKEIGAEETWELITSKVGDCQYNSGLNTAIKLVEESHLSQEDKKVLIGGLEYSKK